MTIFARVDQGLYIGQQTATAPTIPDGEAYSALNLYGAKLITNGTLSVDGNIIEGVAGFGGGIYFDKSIRTFIVPRFSYDCRVTLGTLMAYLLAMGSKTTTGAGPDYLHHYDPYRFNADFPEFTIAMVYGQKTIAGVPDIANSLLPVLTRDCKITEFGFKIGAKDAITMNMGYVGRNSGRGKGTETFVFDNSSHYPTPDIATNTFTLPTWMGTTAGLCVSEADYRWSAKTVTDIACIGKTETLGVLITEAGWDINLMMPLTEVSKSVWEGINYGIGYTALTTLQKSNLSSLTSAIPEGAHTFVMNTGEFITGVIPWSIKGQFDDVQWMSSSVRNGDPLMLDVKGRTFGYNWYLECVNDQTSAAMQLHA